MKEELEQVDANRNEGSTDTSEHTCRLLIEICINGGGGGELSTLKTRKIIYHHYCINNIL